MTEVVRAYRYVNPDQGVFGEFQIVPSQRGDFRHDIMAQTYQAVMNEAWAAQFPGQFEPAQIAQTVDPHNMAFVAQQGLRLAAGNRPDKPIYLHAQITASSRPDWGIVGIGKATHADSRPAWRRGVLAGGIPNDARLADISNVFVRPSLPGSPEPLQGKGYGSAILRSLLDSFPGDMPTVIYDYEMNHRLRRIVADLGFKAVQKRPVDLFGTKVEQTQYRGPLAGDLAEVLEAKRPWLHGRRPLEA